MPGLTIADVRVVVTEENVADHARTQIRTAASAALTAALVPGTVRGVHPGRVHPFQAEDLPAVSVFTRGEAVRDLDVMGGGAHHRELELVVEIRAKADSEATPDLLTVLDTVALEAERALYGDATLNGLLKELDVVTTTTELEGEGTEKPVGLETVVWRCVYRCDPADPSTLVA